MAHADSIDDATLNEIARQVGAVIPSMLPSVITLAGGSELTETFAVWMLSADSILGTGNDLSQLVQNTGRWHSQIRVGGQARLAARAIPLGGDATNWQVRQVLEGLQAPQIDAAISWIDQNIAGDPVARILEIPAYHITAFWLFDERSQESKVVVVSMPPDLTNYLSLEREYTSKEFLDVLRRVGFVVGIEQSSGP